MSHYVVVWIYCRTFQMGLLVLLALPGWEFLEIVGPVYLASFLIIGILPAVFVLHIWNMLFTSNLKFLSCACLSAVLQSKVGCLNVGPPSFDPIPTGSLLGSVPASALATVIICSAVPMASYLAWVTSCASTISAYISLSFENASLLISVVLTPVCWNKVILHIYLRQAFNAFILRPLHQV